MTIILVFIQFRSIFKSSIPLWESLICEGSEYNRIIMSLDVGALPRLCGDSRQGRPRGGEATEWHGDARS